MSPCLLKSSSSIGRSTPRTVGAPVVHQLRVYGPTRKSCSRTVLRAEEFGNRGNAAVELEISTLEANFEYSPPVESLLPSDAEVVPLGNPAEDSPDRFKKIRAVVAGASGGVGRAIVQRLVAEGVPVTALVRDINKAVTLLPGEGSGVTLVRADVTQYMGLPEAFDGSDVLLIATGSRPAPLYPLGPFNVDYEGTVNLITAAKARGFKKVVLVTSIGTDEFFFPLNLLWGVLFWKKRAEEALQRSGLDYTIVRPGGLTNELKAGQREGGIVMRGPGYYGLPPNERPGSILRRQVADICVDALVESSASNKVVEIIAVENAPFRTVSDLFASVIV